MVFKITMSQINLTTNLAPFNLKKFNLQSFALKLFSFYWALLIKLKIFKDFTNPISFPCTTQQIIISLFKFPFSKAQYKSEPSAMS